MIARAAHGGADAERQRLADHRRAALRGELVDERALQAVDERSHRGAGERLGDELSPVGGARAAAAGGLSGELGHEVDALLAEHQGEHERARTVGVFDRNAVELGQRLREQCRGIQEDDRLDARQRERDARADPRHHGGRAHGGAPGGDGGEVAALEHPHDLRRRGVGVAKPDAAHVRHDRRPLHTQHAVERPDRTRMLGRTLRRQTARPGRVVGHRVDAVDLCHDAADPMDAP